MAPSTHVNCQLRMSIPATLHRVEQLLVRLRRHSEAVLDRSNCFSTELLIREALTNAVVHGCGSNPAKHVRCSLRLRKRTLLIAVEDEGPGFNWRGFDWRKAQRNAPAGLECTGRGITILYHYADHVRFNSQGNVVTMIKRLR